MNEWCLESFIEISLFPFFSFPRQLPEGKWWEPEGGILGFIYMLHILRFLFFLAHNRYREKSFGWMPIHNSGPPSLPHHLSLPNWFHDNHLKVVRPSTSPKIVLVNRQKGTSQNMRKRTELSGMWIIMKIGFFTLTEVSSLVLPNYRLVWILLLSIEADRGWGRERNMCREQAIWE